MATVATNRRGGGGSSDHATLSNLTAGDPHTQYAFLAGRAGGQSWTAGTGSGEHATIVSTTHPTKGHVRLGGASGFVYDQQNNRAGLGGTPSEDFDINKVVDGNTMTARVRNASAAASSFARLQIAVNAASTGRPMLQWIIDSGASYVAGISTTANALICSYGATLMGDPIYRMYGDTTPGFEFVKGLAITTTRAGDANQNFSTTIKQIEWTGLTAARTSTLPALSTVLDGSEYTAIFGTGLSATNTVTITPDAGDSIDYGTDGVAYVEDTPKTAVTFVARVTSGTWALKGASP